MSNIKHLLHSCLSESRWMLAFWLACFAWVIGYSLFYGGRPGDELQTVAGIPAWVFWGVVLPWMVATLFSLWFALTQIEDQPLDGKLDEQADRDNKSPP